MATRQRIYQIRILPGNLPFLANLSTRQNGLFWKCAGLARLADIHQPGLLGLARLADICQRPFLKKCDSPRHICTSNERVTQIWASGHCLIIMQI